MKKLLISLLALVLLSGGGYYGVTSTFKQRCNDWLKTASLNLEKGFYAETHKQLTLYFTQNLCRGKHDPDAIIMLAQARLHVPLPENAHLTQQLLLFRLGIGLQKHPTQEKALASAYLVRGNWLEAMRAAKKATKETINDETSLVYLAAAVALENKTETERAIALLSETGLSPFKTAFLDVLAEQNPFFSSVWEKGKATQKTSDMHKLANSLIIEKVPPPPASALQPLAERMTEADLQTVSSLLTSKGHTDTAITLLQQQGKRLSQQLQIRLARLLWQKDDYSLLADEFTNAHSQAPHAPEVLLISCLAQRIKYGTCSTAFDALDYRLRSGVFAASRWAKVMQEVSSPTINIAHLLNALDDMDTLLAGSPVLPQLRFTLLSAIGETELAAPYSKQANIWDIDANIAGLVPPQENNARLDCMNLKTKERQLCWNTALAANTHDISVWKYAIKSGKLLSNQEIETLQQISPTNATLWRIAKARYLLAEETEEAHAEALTVLKPVWQKAPSIPEGHLLASTAYMRFDKPDKAFSHFVAISETSPEDVVTVLRLALWFYEEENRIDAPTLVRWWSALTWLEMSSRQTQNKQVEGPQLLRERLSLLAAYAEETGNEQLGRAVYIKMLEVEPENHIALNNLAYLLSNSTERLTEAKRMAQRAIKLQPNHPEYKQTLKTIQEAIITNSSTATLQ